MTLIHGAFGRTAGPCTECKQVVGNLARHEPVCRREHDAFYRQSDEGGPEMWRLVERAACHSAPPDSLKPEQRFRDGVTDLAVARVMLHLERGKGIMQGGPTRWRAEEGRIFPPGRPSLAQIVDEMIRTGLVFVENSMQSGISKAVVRPAYVHLSRDGALVCGCEALRTRLVQHPDLADCPICRA